MNSLKNAFLSWKDSPSKKEMPIVVVDIDQILETERKAVMHMYDLYKESNNPELLKQMAVRIGNNQITAQRYYGNSYFFLQGEYPPIFKDRNKDIIDESFLEDQDIEKNSEVIKMLTYFERERTKYAKDIELPESELKRDYSYEYSLKSRREIKENQEQNKPTIQRLVREALGENYITKSDVEQADRAKAIEVEKEITEEGVSLDD